MFRGFIFAVFVALSACQTIEREPAPQPNLEIPANAKTGQYVEHKTFSSKPFTDGEISRFMFSDWAGPDFPVWSYVPSGVNMSEAPIMVMLHGAKRNPARYLIEWKDIAQKYGIIVIAPEFARKDFPKSARYNLGNVFDLKSKEINDEKIWTFSAIEPLFDYSVKRLGSNQKTYSITGHSAGSQFVHRFLFYKPKARVKQYFAANAGWYTLPDLEENYPYGLKGANVSLEALKAALSKDVVILIGDQDNNAQHKSLRRTPDAMRQGPHRFARGQYFFDSAQKQATALGVEFGWQLVVVKGVAHSNGGMARGAVPYIK